MHKSYQPTVPAANRLLQKRWDDKYYSEHRMLVRDARPSVDTRPPRTYLHLHMKLKKLQLEEERSATIERDNRILLEKMSNIMRTSGHVNNRNDYAAKSLNHEKRRRELLRVTKENTTMLKRIMRQKSDISRDSWINSWLKNLEYMDNISKYEPEWQDGRSLSRRSHCRQPSSQRSQSAPRNFQGKVKTSIASELEKNKTTDDLIDGKTQQL